MALKANTHNGVFNWVRIYQETTRFQFLSFFSHAAETLNKCGQCHRNKHERARVFTLKV